MSDRNCSTLGSFVSFEVIVEINGSLNFCVMNIESHTSVLKAFWQRAEGI